MRVYLALVACLLWLGGVEGLPALHEAMHAQLGPHRHEGALIIPIDTLDDAPHDPAFDALLAQLDDGSPDEPDAQPPRPARTRHDDAHARLARALGHAHGLAHHDLAVHAPAIPLHAPLPIDRRPTSLVAAAIATPISALTPAAAARGPPAPRAR